MSVPRSFDAPRVNGGVGGGAAKEYQASATRRLYLIVLQLSLARGYLRQISYSPPTYINHPAKECYMTQVRGPPFGNFPHIIPFFSLTASLKLVCSNSVLKYSFGVGKKKQCNGVRISNCMECYRVIWSVIEN